MIEKQFGRIAIYRQCALVGLARTTLYYRKRRSDAIESADMHLIDELYMKYPFYGIRRITNGLKRVGRCINHKRAA